MRDHETFRRRSAIGATALCGALLGCATASAAQAGVQETIPGNVTPGRGLAPAMKVKELGKSAHTFQVVLSKGDEIASGLTDFAEKNHLTAGHLTAFGAIDSAVLGWYDPAKKNYRRIAIGEEVEVVSLTGDIALRDGKPYVHAHLVVAYPDGTTKGGHLVEAHVSVTLHAYVVDDSQ